MCCKATPKICARANKRGLKQTTYKILNPAGNSGGVRFLRYVSFILELIAVLGQFDQLS